ncbi:hypothetical protein [Clostridium sp. Marseille-P2415]|uniref:hypothetical protein n=1 Tax=Clostridium sp. Marseille-P2415 TaxID=1805471 RepID=UPI001F24BB46|nr:hypothetical protein [Clostridium sp. Marseille-P2415]
MLNKKRLINITDLVVELNGKNLFEELLTDEIMTMKLFSLIKEHFKAIDSDTLNVWLKNILAEFVRIKELHGLASESDELYLSVKSILAAELRDIAYKDILEFSEKTYNAELYQKFFDHNPFVTTKNDYNTIAILYTIILMEILVTLKTTPYKVNINLDIYFTYQPPQLFKRISSQQSFFIYQPYLYTNGVYNYCELNIHSINPDILIEIDNYSNILKELYLLGIDNGTIYGDIDNIAKSVLNSSGKLFKA